MINIPTLGFHFAVFGSILEKGREYVLLFFHFLHALLYEVTISILLFSFIGGTLLHFLPLLCFMFVVVDSKLLLSHYFLS